MGKNLDNVIEVTAKANYDSLNDLVRELKKFDNQTIDVTLGGDAKKQIDGLRREIEELAKDIATIFYVFDKIPSKDVIDKLEKETDAINSKIITIQNSVKSFSNQLDGLGNAGDFSTLKSQLNEVFSTLKDSKKYISELYNSLNQNNSSGFIGEEASIDKVLEKVNELTKAIGETKVTAIEKESAKMKEATNEEVGYIQNVINKVKELKDVIEKLPKNFVPDTQTAIPESKNVKVKGKVQKPKTKKKSNTSYINDVKRLSEAADDSEKISKLANSLEEIAIALQDIDKCTNVSSVIGGLKVNKTTVDNLSGVSTALEQIKNSLTGLSDDGMNFLTKLSEITKQADALKTVANTIKQNSGNNSRTNTKDASYYQQKALDKYNKFERTSSDKKYYSELKSEFQKLKEEAENLGDEEGLRKFEESLSELRQGINRFQKLKGTLTKDDFESLNAAIEGAKDYAIGNDAVSANLLNNTDLKNGLHRIIIEAKNAKGEVQDLTFTYNKNLKKMSVETGEWRKELTGVPAALNDIKNKFNSMVIYWVANLVTLQDAINWIGNGISIATEFDTLLTEMRKVSNEAESILKNYQNASFEIAESVGTTAQSLNSSTADWMRLGKSLEDASELAKNTSILMNVSEFENVNDATDSLISMTQAYQELDSIDIIDKLNLAGNNFSISTSDLAQSLQKSSAALKVAGNDINEAIALTVAGNSILQDPDSVAAGIRTISLRITGTEEAKNELKALGEDVDDYVVQTSSKMQKQIKDFTAVASNGFKGVDILDGNGNYRNTYQILLSISKIWDEIEATDKKFGTNHKNGLLELMAGKQRSNILASILEDAELLEDVYNQVQNAEGSAEQELNKYLDSIEGRMSQLKTEAQEFWYNLIDSDTVKTVVSGLTNILDLVNKIVGATGGFGTTLTTATTLLSVIKNIGMRNKHQSLSFA